MKRLVFTVSLLYCHVVIQAQEKFIESFPNHFNGGDTISIDCNVKPYNDSKTHLATLYLTIENIDTKIKRLYRYPMADGISEVNMIIDSNLHAGRYLFSFYTRKGFFSLHGYASQKENAELTYSLRTNKNESFIEKIKTNETGNFSIKGILFEDTCYLSFYDTKSKGQKMNLTITTPLDSAFLPDFSYQQIVYIGKTDTLSTVQKANLLSDSSTVNFFESTLPEVTVSTIKKKPVELFNEEFSTGLFNNPSERIFDGLDNNNIAESTDILEFLRGRVAGLKVMRAANGNFTLEWQGPSSFRGGSNVDVFLDEVKLDRLSPGIINPADVAMIKAIPPPAFLSPGGQRASICIYSKKQSLNKSTGGEIKFKVFGYSPMNSFLR